MSMFRSVASSVSHRSTVCCCVLCAQPDELLIAVHVTWPTLLLLLCTGCAAFFCCYGSCQICSGEQQRDDVDSDADDEDKHDQASTSRSRESGNAPRSTRPPLDTNAVVLDVDRGDSSEDTTPPGSRSTPRATQLTTVQDPTRDAETARKASPRRALDVENEGEHDASDEVASCTSVSGDGDDETGVPKVMEPVVVALKTLRGSFALRGSPVSHDWSSRASNKKLEVDDTHRDDYTDERRAAKPSVGGPSRQIRPDTVDSMSKPMSLAETAASAPAAVRSYKRAPRCAPPSYIAARTRIGRGRRSSTMADILSGQARPEIRKASSAGAVRQGAPRRTSLGRMVDRMRARQDRDGNERGRDESVGQPATMGEIISELRRSLRRTRI